MSVKELQNAVSGLGPGCWQQFMEFLKGDVGGVDGVRGLTAQECRELFARWRTSEDIVAPGYQRRRVEQELVRLASLTDDGTVASAGQQQRPAGELLKSVLIVLLTIALYHVAQRYNLVGFYVRGRLSEEQVMDHVQAQYPGARDVSDAMHEELFGRGL
eukprot:TRINITY_DN35720_c0_g1_i1.p1 TRINITY_DN35720_c0_g1~~TRINITY_DN35720_c0_g1_i1.p1  ORF type:complete len:159 (+),score=61.39 TRINITY_DN35720_c0_g1_i1:45-521(+)